MRSDAAEQVAAAEAHRDQALRAAGAALVPHRDLMSVSALSRDRVYRILRAAPGTSGR